jgi:hypothetical protein
MSIVDTLGEVQRKLKAPKGQTNKFGGYKYRNCEDILEALKKVMPQGVTVIIHDDIQVISDRVYVKATAMLSNGKETVETTAFAREPLTKKGMDESQITGAASSYARKYALNGLFLIDDTKDADSMDNRNTHEVDLKIQGIAAHLIDELERDNIHIASKIWFDLDEESKKKLWVAKSKGGYFDQATKKIIQSTEFREAYWRGDPDLHDVIVDKIAGNNTCLTNETGEDNGIN